MACSQGFYLALFLVSVAVIGHVSAQTCDSAGLTRCREDNNQTSLPATPTPAQCTNAKSFIDCLDGLIQVCASNSSYADTIRGTLTPVETAWNSTCGNLPTCSMDSVRRCQNEHGGKITELMKSVVSDPCPKGTAVLDCLKQAAETCGDNAVGKTVKAAVSTSDKAFRARCSASGLMPSILLILGAASFVINRLRQ